MLNLCSWCLSLIASINFIRVSKTKKTQFAYLTQKRHNSLACVQKLLIIPSLMLQNYHTV